jgi:dipeptidyl aminopeptidase/acylaminoacyl peptidase
MVAGGGIRLGGVIAHQGGTYWLEMRPVEGGRNTVIKRSADGDVTELVPAPFNVRTRVHEYGGGSYMVNGEWFFFSNFKDQRLYRVRPGEEPVPLTPPVDLRYADAVYDARRNRLVCVREDHTGGGHEPENTIVGLPVEGENAGTVLVSGYNFFSNPRLSSDGTQLAYLAWNHPNMPWDGCELHLAELDDNGAVVKDTVVAGGLQESIFQPEWSQAGFLHFVSDRSGWWNHYRLEENQAVALYPMEAEFGQPAWTFRQSAYGFADDGKIVCSYGQNGFWNLGLLDPATRQMENLRLPLTAISSVSVDGKRVVFLGGSAGLPMSVIQLDLTTRQMEILKRPSELKLDRGYLSTPEAITYPTEAGKMAYAIYYRPTNQDYSAPSGEKPPLLVQTHGGPTGSTTTVPPLEYSYWTSRGFAILDVNYGGSTGYGREYRERLNGKWGIVDVDDCVNGVRYLVEKGEVDGDRVAINGGSAGGYTTLCALTFRDTFKAGASYFGVSNLEALAQDTHKFESRYLDNLVGPYPARRDIYLERSPIHHTVLLNCPLILFQGLENKVVPPNQAELMFEAVKKKGIPVAYIPFEGEQHGFRIAANIKRALEAEFYFYSRIFGYSPADPIEPVQIENLVR